VTYFADILIPSVWSRFLELLTAPAVNPEMGWIITPLIVTLVLMTFYFGKYSKEDLGYNTSVGNAVVLLFVGMDILRYVYYSEFPPSLLAYQNRPVVALVCLLVMFEAIALLYSSFFHTLPKKINYFICSPLPVNLQAYVAIAVVYSRIKFDWYTLLAAFLLFFALFLTMRLLQKLQHVTSESIHKARIEEVKEEAKEAAIKQKQAKKKEKKLKEEEKEHNK